MTPAGANAERTVSDARTKIRLEITSVAAGGEGVGHVDREDGRRAVFVAQSAPGDVIDAEIDFAQRPARATGFRLVRASPLRVTPPCPLAGTCGGCDLMHLTLDAQRAARRAIVTSALERGLHRADATATLPEVVVHSASASLGYRTRARVAVRARGGDAIVGYRRAGSRFLQDVATCAVLDPRLDRALPELRRLFQGETGDGEASLALGAEAKPVLDLAWTGDLSPRVFA